MILPYNRMKQAGFTLVELCVVMVLAGILVTAALMAYRVEMERRTIDTTKKNITTAHNAIAAFQRDNGYYPCPASGTDPAGRAGDCSNIAGSGFKRVSIGGQTLRIGTMPISAPDKDGNTVQFLSGDQALDGYRRRLTYAVLENHAVDPARFSAAGKGKITILDANSTDSPPISTTSYYAVFSAGPDGAGAYTYAGVEYAPCNTDTTDSENCDNDAVFADSLVGARSLASGANYFDDFFAGQTEAPVASTPGGALMGSADIDFNDTFNGAHVDKTCRSVWGAMSCEPQDRKILEKGRGGDYMRDQKGLLLTCKKSQIIKLYTPALPPLVSGDSPLGVGENQTLSENGLFFYAQGGFYGCIDNGSDTDTSKYIVSNTFDRYVDEAN